MDIIQPANLVLVTWHLSGPEIVKSDGNRTLQANIVATEVVVVMVNRHYGCMWTCFYCDIEHDGPLWAY